MARFDRRTDDALLQAAFDDREAFAVFYARFERSVAAFFVRATGSGELAADLTAEVFAQALDSAVRLIRRSGPRRRGCSRSLVMCCRAAASADG